MVTNYNTMIHILVFTLIFMIVFWCWHSPCSVRM